MVATAAWTTVTATPAPGTSRLPLSSTARALMVKLPADAGAQAKLQLSRPLAGCQVDPPSTETSTPPTTPPPESVALPVMFAATPAGSEAPAAGVRMVDTGGVVSVEAVAGVSPAWSETGCAPMSANRLTVACCMRTSVVAPRLARSWFASRPHDHWYEPEAKTSAPLACLYSESRWVPAPAP